MHEAKEVEQEAGEGLHNKVHKVFETHRIEEKYEAVRL